MDARFILLLTIFRLCEAIASPSIVPEDKNTVDAGVRSRLSQRGVNFLAGVLTKTLMSEVASAGGDFELSDIHLPTEKVSVASTRIIFRNSPKKIFSNISAPNVVHVQVPELSIVSKSELSVRGVPTTVIAEIFALTFTVSFNVSVLRSANSAPKLELNGCDVTNTSAIDVTLGVRSQALKDEKLKKQLQNSLKERGASLIKQLVCSRINFVLEDRINRRFDILPTKLTLAKIHEDVIVKELVQRMRTSNDPTRQRRAALLSSFNVSRAENLYLDYALVSDPWVSPLGLELQSRGEVSIKGQGGTPFSPVKIPFPETVNDEYMLQMAVSDYMTNSLLFNGHKVALFNARVDPKTPYFGPIMRTTCRMASGLMFCLGDLFPTLRKLHSDHKLALFFNTVQPPVIQFRPPSTGGITFSLLGKIIFLLIDKQDNNVESKVAEMEIDVKAHMKLRLSNTDIKPKIALDNTTLTPAVLLQDELDQAAMLARKVLQRMVNDILSDGIPIPLHPLFRLNKPKIKILERALLLQTNFELNESLLQKIVFADILARQFNTTVMSGGVGGSVTSTTGLPLAEA